MAALIEFYFRLKTAVREREREEEEGNFLFALVSLLLEYASWRRGGHFSFMIRPVGSEQLLLLQ